MSALIFIFAFIFFVVAIACFKSIRSPSNVLNPLIMPLVVWTLSYPIRAILVEIFRDKILSQNYLLAPPPEIYYILSLIYSTAFLFCLYVVLNFQSKQRLTIELPIYANLKINRKELHALTFLFYIYIFCFAYQFSYIGFSALYEDFESLKKNAFDIIIGEFLSLKWFLLATLFFSFKVSNSRVLYFYFCSVIATVIIPVLMSTSKGNLLSLCYVYLMALAIVNAKQPSRSFFIFAAIIFYIFSIYSYEIRDKLFYEIRSGALIGTGLFDLIVEAILNASFTDVLEKYTFTVLDRVTYYGDGLASMISGSTNHSNDLYIFGSISEFLNIIPSNIWPGRPHISFNHYVTSAVWGNNIVLSEIPIGRIGESFYVAGYAGIFYGIVYALIFLFVIRLFRMCRNNIFGLGFWVALMVGFVMPDAFIVYNWKYVLFLFVAFIILKKITYKPQ